MGTKLKPGLFDCYEHALPDEPMFILLGRDSHAPALVRLWADLRAAEGENYSKLVEARQCADAMEQWRADADGKWRQPAPEPKRESER